MKKGLVFMINLNMATIFMGLVWLGVFVYFLKTVKNDPTKH